MNTYLKMTAVEGPAGAGRVKHKNARMSFDVFMRAFHFTYGYPSCHSFDFLNSAAGGIYFTVYFPLCSSSQDSY